MKRFVQRTPSLAALVTAAALSAGMAPVAQAQAGSGAKQTITRADQLPRRSYTLPKLPSEMLEMPAAELATLLDLVEKDILTDLATYDIQDNATLRGHVSTRLSIAMLRGDWAAVPALAAQLRALQDKAGAKLTAGLVSEIVAQAKREGAGPERVQALVTERTSAMPWAEVQDNLKAAKGQFEIANPTLMQGGLKAQADPAARNANMRLDGGFVAGLISAKAQYEHVLPLRQAIVAGLQPVIDRHAAVANAKPDRWSERQVVLPADAQAAPVVVGIWDSGVDMKLFKPAGQRGLAFGADSRPTDAILRPLGDTQARWPQLRGLVKGAMDLRAALDTPDAQRLKQTIGQLKPEQVKAFQEDMSLVGLYTHGTHVAGIAVAGNPFAQVYPVSMHWPHEVIPPKPSEEQARRTAANYKAIVDGFKAAGVKVVNMSWRYGPGFYEGALAFHGIGKDGEERKKMAQALFKIERDALKAAFESAPEILFVAGSGNEDNNADFVEYIPAGFELPNLITAGAVDQAGEETSFSTFGKTVVVHANGFEVDSYVPGGDKLKLSGTSMAAPQVTNLAAKLWALNPKLTVAEVKQLILQGAERQGRVNLIHPKKTLSLAEAKRS